MKIRVYAKSAVDLNNFDGAYSYCFRKEDGVKYTNTAVFRNKVKTMAHADCAAFGNALFILSTMVIAAQVTEIELVTDSGVVEDLFTIYKAQKHCEDIGRYWREKTKPAFTNLQKVTAIKIGRKPVAGDKDNAELIRLGVVATGTLNTKLEHYK